MNWYQRNGKSSEGGISARYFRFVLFAKVYVVKGRHLGNGHAYVQCISRRASVYMVRDNLLGCSMIDWLQYDRLQMYYTAIASGVYQN